MSRRDFSPNQACLLGSYNPEWISVRVLREGGSPIMQAQFPQGCKVDIWELENPESGNLGFCTLGIEVEQQGF